MGGESGDDGDGGGEVGVDVVGGVGIDLGFGVCVDVDEEAGEVH